MEALDKQKEISIELKLKEDIWEALTSVYDPEIGLDIVNLGLIYDVSLTKDKNAQGVSVEIALTLTSPACPLGGFIIDTIRSTIATLDEKIFNVNVQLVWDPPWSKECISERGKMELGLI